MYLQHFRIRELPFTLTPDTAFFMERAGYLDALNVLLVALRSGEGFVKVIGEVGTGKTLLCRRLINSLGSDFRCAYLPNPYLSPASLLLSIVEELGIPYPTPCSQHLLLRRLNAALLKFAAAGKHVVVCMDEAQAVPQQTLEVLRLLTNLETEKRKLVQVVLFGQPELDGVLDQPSIRQLRQRISFSYELLPLDRLAVDSYLLHRLSVAGYEGPRLFHPKAVDEIFRGSRGVPRLINILAHKALMAAFGEGMASVERRHALLAVNDTADARKVRGPRFRWFGGRLFHWFAGHAS